MTASPARMLLALGLLAPAPAALAQDGEPARRAGGFESVLPADTVAFVGVADLQAWMDQLDAHPWGRFWVDPECAPFRSQIEAVARAIVDEAAKESGLDVAAALEQVQGGIAAAVIVELPDDLSSIDEPDDLALSVLALFGLSEERTEIETAVERMYEAIEDEHPDAIRRSLEVGSVDVTELAFDEEKIPTAVRSAFAGDVLVVEAGLNGSSAIEAVLDELGGDGHGAVLADEPRFRGSIASRRGGTQLWIDNQRLTPWWQHLIDQLAASSLGDDQTAGFFNRSGLLAIKDIAASSATEAEGTRFELHVRWPAGGWLHEALECLAVPVGLGHLSAAPADAVGVTAWRADFPRLFDLTVKQLVASGAFEMPEIVAGLSSFEESTGFALRDDLLENLDGHVTAATCVVEVTEAFPGATADPQNFALMVGLKDGGAFNTLLEDFVRKQGFHAARKREEFQGFEVFNIPILPGFSVTYAVTPDMLVASLAPTLVQEVLRRRSGAEVPRFSEREDLDPLLARLDAGRGAVGISDAAAGAYGFVAGFVGAISSRFAGDDEGNAIARALGALEVPERDVFDRHFHGLTAWGVTVDEAGLRMEFVGP